jgi:hypothetical protein
MRARLVLFFGATLLLPVVVAVQACGDTEKPGPGDAGGQALEAAAEAAADAAKCDLSASLTGSIPDAAIADGASTTGICLGCGNAKCANFVKQCTANCDCQRIAKDGLECYLANPANAELCVLSFGVGKVDPKVQAIGLGLGNCINTNCKSECAADAFNDAGTDGGP